MIYFKDYLNAISNKHIISLHKKISQKTGLVKIEEAKEGLVELFSKAIKYKFSPFEKNLLTAIYGSQIRGVTTEEINNYSKAYADENLVEVLRQLEQKMLIYVRESSVVSYHGFKDFVDKIFDRVTSKKPISKKSSSWKVYSYYLVPHIVTILSRLRSKKVRITNDNQIHRKNVKYILAQIKVPEQAVFPFLLDEEFKFIVSFLNDEGCFHQNEFVLIFSNEVHKLLKTETILCSRLYTWWRRNKLLSQSFWLKSCVNLRKIWNIAELSHMVASYEDPISRKIKFGTTYLDYQETGLEWEKIPRMIRELWLLGGLDISVTGKLIQEIKWNKERMFMILGLTDVVFEKQSETIFLANFEVLADHHTNPLLRYEVELISEKINNDIMTRYCVTKDSILKCLQVFSVSYFMKIIDKLKFSSEQIKVMENWTSNFLCACFEEISVLRLSNMEKWEELKQIPDFNNFVQEEIPNFGIIYKKKDKENLFQLLKSIGIVPKDKVTVNEVVVKDFNFYSEYRCNTQSFHSDPIILFSNILDLDDESVSKVKNKQKLPNFAEKMDLIEKAIKSISQLEVSFVEQKKRFSVIPLCILEENILIATNIRTGCREQFEIREMTSLRFIS